jgi:hypothetical protein
MKPIFPTEPHFIIFVRLFNILMLEAEFPALAHETEVVGKSTSQ